MTMEKRNADADLGPSLNRRDQMQQSLEARKTIQKNSPGVFFIGLAGKGVKGTSEKVRQKLERDPETRSL